MASATPSRTVRAQLPLALLCFAVLPKLIGLRLPVDDPFHLGEAFAAAITLIANPSGGSRPLTLHGAWDFIPALVSRALWGDANYFYPTIYLTDSLLPALSALLFLLFLCRILKDRNGPAVTMFLCMAALAAPSLVGIRDLFLLISCWSLVELLDADSKRVAIQALSVLVPATAIGLLWSLDRGLVGAATVMTALLAAAGLRRRPLFIHAALLILAACGAAIWIGEWSGSISYATNLGFVIRTSSQWRYPWSPGLAGNVALAVSFTACTLLATGSGRSGWREPGFTPVWMGLAVCSLLMVRMGTNRADLIHILPAMWPALVLSAVATKRGPAPTGQGRGLLMMIAVLIDVAVVFFAVSAVRSWTPLLIVGATCLLWAACLLPERADPLEAANRATDGEATASVNPTPHQQPAIAYGLVLVLFVLTALSSGQDWLATLQGLGRGSLVTPLQFVQQGVPYARIADAGQAWAAQQIRDSGSACILDMSNSGIINAGADKPVCTRFAYPVYASQQDQSALIRDLKATAPTAIVYSTTAWQYAIDGQAMTQRLPRVDRFLKRQYPQETCHQGLCIRQSRSLQR
ncbi:MAG: hypothetical protein VKO65_06280 [Cyanobacteriota bacterium]|nr:hypothetical protein [Cyanobacteriota bacterium]